MQVLELQVSMLGYVRSYDSPPETAELHTASAAPLTVLSEVGTEASALGCCCFT